jgi:hypothetical protein
MAKKAKGSKKINKTKKKSGKNKPEKSFSKN